MALQTENLAMVGLGVLQDEPPNEMQPQLVAGIHLRWAFKRERGFPWYGYYLFRRRRRQGKPVCLQQLAAGFGPGSLHDNVFNLPNGNQIESDQLLHLTDDFPLGGDGKVEFDLEHRRSIWLRFPDGQPVRSIEVTIGFRQDARIEVTALMGEIPVAQTLASGNAGAVVTVSLEFDAMSGVKIGPGPAALIDLCYLFVADEATEGWELLPDFSYPLRLPVFHPDYPCALGASEDIETARTVAGDRILYGHPDEFVQSGYQPGQGTISVANGSAIVKGTGAGWNEEAEGAVLLVGGDSTAYTIMKVVSSNKLVLSREYGGLSRNNVPYQICQDTFGQMHDLLVQLVSGGPTSPTGMAYRSIPLPVYNIGTVSVDPSSKLVAGAGTNWNSDLAGLNFQVGTNEAIYTIASVKSNNQLELDRAYSGTKKISGKAYRIFAALMPVKTEEESPSMPQQRPLDLILLGALNPAMAQMAGLYWLDRTVERDTAYDYLIVADDAGYFFDAKTNSFDPTRIFSDLEEGIFPDLDGYIVFNKKLEIPEPLEPPEDPRVYALPGGFIYSQEQGLLDAQNNAGLRWNPETQGGIILPGKAIMYHLWRAGSGKEEPEHAPIAGQYDPITKGRPVLITRPAGGGGEPQRPANWPLFPLHFIDRGLDEFAGAAYGLKDGWYSYQVSGIDIFGRHSANSAPAQWYQWAPVSQPRPWYYQAPPGDRAIHPFAVHLLDKIPPPPPAGIEAYALDPADPTVLQDKAYKDWRASLSAADKNKIGLRVSWLWTPAHMRQAWDTHEFRIYYQPEHMNAAVGQVVSVTTTGPTERAVQTDIPNAHPAGAYVGARLNIGPDSFTIVGSDAGTPLQVRVKVQPVYTAGTAAVGGGSTTVKISGANVSKAQVGQTFKLVNEKASYTILGVDPATQELTLDRSYKGPDVSGQAYTIAGKLPYADTLCNVAIPAPYGVGKIAVSNGSTLVSGANTAWSKELAGRTFQLLGESATYTIVQVDSETQLTLKTPYQGPDRKEKAYLITHPLSIDYTLATNWQKRLHVVAYNEAVTETIRIGQDANGKELSGKTAAAAGKVVSLDGKPDLSGLTAEAGSPFAAYLYLKNDTNRPSKLYRITAMNNSAKTVTLDGIPNIAGGASNWSIGLPVRKYEVFLLAPGDQLFEPSPAKPIVYANIGVSAVDDKPHTLDDPRWAAGLWGGRYGNEGQVGGLVTIARVHRIPPEPPVPPPDSEKVYASLPDYHSHAFYTYRWEPQKYLKTHIFRALDDTLFRTDWARRSQNKALLLDSNNPNHKKFFPLDWNVNKHQAVANELKGFVLTGAAAAVAGDLVTLDGTPDLTKVKAGRDFLWLKADTGSPSRCYFIISVDTNTRTVTVGGEPKLSGSTSQWAIPLYPALSNDALRVLAGLPGNEQAFTQLTIQPLDPKDPATANRRGPDDPDDFKLDTPNKPLTSKSLRAYLATLDGRSTNRYFFRSAYVDDAHNRSKELSLSSPPVYLRNVMPPRSPVFTRILAGDPEQPTQSQDCKITLYWASNREADLAEYRLYRTADSALARDIRLMDLAGTIAAPAGQTPPSEVIWVDDTVQGLVTYYYRLAAVDDKGNVSTPSAVITARAFDTGLPELPLLTVEWVEQKEQTGAQISWTSPHEVLLQHRKLDEPWADLGQWQPSGQVVIRDQFSDPGQSYEYRVRVRKYTGTIALGPAVTLKAQHN